MREIKFRAWHKEKKEIVNIEEIDFMNKVINYIDNDYENNRQEIIGAYFEDIDLMEYTGLKDKNGKEIYEGDIFHIGSKKILYVVEWIDCGLKGKQIRNGSWIGLDFWKKDIEILGNIYENPELLGGQ